MRSTCRNFEYLILRPTLRALGEESDAAVNLLLGTVLAESCFRSPQPGKHGYYGITPTLHRQVWDQYLAFRPDLASQVRAIASKDQFLDDPHAELDNNPAYATAIAWLAYTASGFDLPAADDYHSLALLWVYAFHDIELQSDCSADPWWFALGSKAA